jgi:hypothetical protein
MDDKKLINSMKQIADNRMPASTNIWPEIKDRLNSQPSKLKTKPLRKVWSAAVFGLAVIVLLFFTVPSARAFLEDVFETIGGMTFTLTDDYPVGWPVRTIPSENLPLEQVQNDFPFFYPEWVPGGYELDSDVRTTWWPDDSEDRPSIELTWINQEGRGNIMLLVSQSLGEIVGQITIQMLEINGQEVAYWKGGWYYNTKTWNETLPHQTLSWSIDDLGYRLSASDSIPLDDLIQMVESMLP